MLSRRIQKIDASGIRKVFDLATKLKAPVNLSIGEPDFFIPSKIKNNLKKAIDENKNRYTVTQGIESLRKKIAQKLGKENKIKVAAENVLITSGTSGAIDLLFRAALDPGDEVIIPDPYFVVYKHMTVVNGAKPVFVDTYCSNFVPEPEKIAAKITARTKAIILNSPANPTGAVYPEKIIREIIEVARKNNILIISDEVYEKFVYDAVHFSSGSIYKNTVTLNGFSKSYAMTGLRLGYAVGPTEIIAEMTKLQQYTYVCAPSVVQHGALVALSVDTKKQVAEYKRKRDLIYKGIKDHYEVIKPAGAFYIFPKVPSRYSNATEFAKTAIKNNLLIIPGNVFSEQDTRFRISFAADDETIKGGIKILRKLS